MPLIAALLAALAMWQAERLHARRVTAVARLAFGSHSAASRVAKLTPPIRAVAVSAIAWGMVALLQLPAQRRLRDPAAADGIDPKDLKRILLVLDVSPSMRIKDASSGTMTRAQRAADVLMNLIGRVDLNRARVTVAAFYTGVKPVVIDAIDPGVIEHIVYNDTLDQAFEDGETDLGVAVRGAYDLAKDWRPGSATLLIVTDGDSAPINALPTRPPSIARALLIGVGDIDRGTFIDNHVSRQDPAVLQNLAGQLGGAYADANSRNVPSDVLSDLSGLIESLPPGGIATREYAIASVAIGAALLCVMPMLLAAFGTRLTPAAIAGRPAARFTGRAA